MAAQVEAQVWHCIPATEQVDMCVNTNGWGEGKCRVCERTDELVGHQLGIVGGVYLEDGCCPNCGISPPPANVCQFCGGQAKPGNFWDALVGSSGPSTPAVLDLITATIVGLELEVKDHQLPRSELDRLMKQLYGKRAKRREFQRNSWRWIIGEYTHGSALGESLSMELKSTPKKKDASS